MPVTPVSGPLYNNEDPNLIVTDPSQPSPSIRDNYLLNDSQWQSIGGFVDAVNIPKLDGKDEFAKQEIQFQDMNRLLHLDNAAAAEVLRNLLTAIINQIKQSQGVLTGQNTQITTVNAAINAYNTGVPGDQTAVNNLNSAISTYNTAVNAYNQAVANYNDSGSPDYLNVAILTTAYNNYVSALNTYNAAVTTYNNYAATRSGAISTYNSSIAPYNLSVTAYNAQIVTINANIDKINAFLSPPAVPFSHLTPQDPLATQSLDPQSLVSTPPAPPPAVAVSTASTLPVPSLIGNVTPLVIPDVGQTLQTVFGAQYNLLISFLQGFAINETFSDTYNEFVTQTQQTGLLKILSPFILGLTSQFYSSDGLTTRFLELAMSSKLVQAAASNQPSPLSPLDIQPLQNLAVRLNVGIGLSAGIATAKLFGDNLVNKGVDERVVAIALAFEALKAAQSIATSGNLNATVLQIIEGNPRFAVLTEAQKEDLVNRLSALLGLSLVESALSRVAFALGTPAILNVILALVLKGSETVTRPFAPTAQALDVIKDTANSSVFKALVAGDLITQGVFTEKQAVEVVKEAYNNSIPIGVNRNTITDFVNKLADELAAKGASREGALRIATNAANTVLSNAGISDGVAQSQLASDNLQADIRARDARQSAAASSSTTATTSTEDTTSAESDAAAAKADEERVISEYVQAQNLASDIKKSEIINQGIRRSNIRRDNINSAANAAEAAKPGVAPAVETPRESSATPAAAGPSTVPPPVPNLTVNPLLDALRLNLPLDALLVNLRNEINSKLYQAFHRILELHDEKKIETTLDWKVFDEGKIQQMADLAKGSRISAQSLYEEFNSNPQLSYEAWSLGKIFNVGGKDFVDLVREQMLSPINTKGVTKNMDIPG